MDQEKIQQAKARLGIVGNSPELSQAVARALRVAPIDMSVLVTGESGSGKEFFPKIIHNYSPRKHAKYIAVNCGAIPEGTIDSELFGHEKGAFTGAVASRKGYFEEADGGTIFLDEVAELPLTTQARLLRVLESGEFMKVGSSQVQKTNIRVVAATNEDMRRAVAERRFREDLYYRLSTVQISVPPLRDRGTDILLLARKFATDFAERYRTVPVEFSDGAREALLRYRWPGNVRQLKNVVEQMSVFEAGNVVGIDMLEAYLPQSAGSYAPVPVGAPRAGGSDDDGGESRGRHSYSSEREMLLNLILRLQREIQELREEIRGHHPAPKPEPLAIPQTALVKYRPAVSDLRGEASREPQPQAEAMTLEQTERETIRQSLERNQGRRKATAAELNISERTLYRKIKEYGLE